MVCRIRKGSGPAGHSAVLPTLRRAACAAKDRRSNCFSNADVVYDAAMTLSLIATPNRQSLALAPGHGMTPGSCTVGVSAALAAQVDSVRARTEAE